MSTTTATTTTAQFDRVQPGASGPRYGVTKSIFELGNIKGTANRQTIVGKCEKC